MKKPKAVVDTNLLVNGIIVPKGNPYFLLEAWRKGLFTLVTSQQQLDKLEEVLTRPKIYKTYHLLPKDISIIIQLINQKAVIVLPSKTSPVLVRDSKDTFVIQTALAGKADYIVSGDKDLLVLNNDAKLTPLFILTASEFRSSIITI
ncbi:putative toxin-antitoxin system toxin component, PIN family [Candidatus Roizmanbacteria bacterium]|nr:putative toxin-antitoxin system toxin component, PIN family [Candidatus Roizmanbacteria bacterium]